MLLKLQYIVSYYFCYRSFYEILNFESGANVDSWKNVWFLFLILLTKCDDAAGDLRYLIDDTAGMDGTSLSFLKENYQNQYFWFNHLFSCSSQLREFVSKASLVHSSTLGRGSKVFRGSTAALLVPATRASLCCVKQGKVILGSAGKNKTKEGQLECMSQVSQLQRRQTRFFIQLVQLEL